MSAAATAPHASSPGAALSQPLQALLRANGWSRDLPDSGIGSHVGGELIPGGGELIEVINPADGEPLFWYRDASAEAVRAAGDSCAAAQRGWGGLPPVRRAATLRAIAVALAPEIAALAQIEALTSGKTITDCHFQLHKVVEMFDYYAGWADKLYGAVIPVPTGSLNYTLREPIGVVLHIVPWNSPLFMAGWHVAPTIAAGNAVVLKPSELTPLTAILLARIAESAGLPRGVLNVLNGYGHTAGTAAIAHAAIAKVGFVGSPGVGRKVAASAAARPVPCMLELGGKSASIVFADADLDAACQGVISGIFGASGQSCVAAARVVVERGVQAPFIDKLRHAASGLRMGDPLDPATRVGPINNRRQKDHIEKMIAGAQAAGATCFRAPTGFAGRGHFVAPTILSDVRPDMQIAQEEVFGPVLSVLPFDSEDEAVAIANGTEFALAGGVWTNDIRRAHRVAARVNAGTFWINTYKETDISSPFGGNALSGYGRSSGMDALLEYTRVKSVWVSMR